MFSEETRKIVRRLQTARLSLMQKQPFYAVLLLHMRFSLDLSCETVYTDGTRIAFCPDFLESLSDTELEFVLMHEVLHAALNHSGRTLDSYDFDDFNKACDVVVNSNILYSCGMDVSAITLKGCGESMHLAPDGKEGYLYTAEDVYEMIRAGIPSGKDGGEGKGRNGSRRKEGDPSSPDGGGSNEADSGKSGREPDGGTASRKDGGFDDHTFWGTDDEGGQGTDGRNGKPDLSEKNADMRNQWLQRMIEAAQITERMRGRETGRGCGPVPLGVQRIVKELTEPQTDWRTVLDTFVQEEISDYSFDPPDRRFQDSPFLLPDYNETEDRVRDILFMIDTSASMSDSMITRAYSEICGAIRQFGGKLQGWLGFFDANVVEPKEFCDEEEFRIIRPKGGGGTSFQCIFDYLKEHRDEIAPASMVILTDGFAPFPEEVNAMGIPVLWLINNDEVSPPWGKVTRIRIDDDEDRRRSL